MLGPATLARGAGCATRTCPDDAAVDNVRELVAAACDCVGAASPRKYVTCAKAVVKGAVRRAELSRSCRGAVVRCEAKSTCGRAKANVCCVTSPKGKVKALMVRGTKCPKSGNLCQNRVALVDACTDDGTCTRRRGIRSFKSVQRVFQTSCALGSCHSTFARKGGLVLETEDLSYASLVDRPAAHPEATDLLRVKTGDPGASFLIKKLRGEGPGESMPDTGGLLPDPVIEMIADWIARGAKSTKDECKSPGPGEESLCDDEPIATGDYTWAPLPPLEVPAPGTGVQLYLPPRDVPSGQEWEMCYAFRAGKELPPWAETAAAVGMPPGQLPAISKQVYRMHPGSHHLLLYAYIGAHPEQFADGYFPCQAANCVNPADCPIDADGIDGPGTEDDDNALVLPIGGTQVAGTRYEVTYPPGVGVPILTPNSVLIVNPHFTNPFQPAQAIYGESWLNLYFHPPGEFDTILDGIFAVNAVDLLVEPFATRTISRIWSPRSILGGASVDANVFQLFGHFHKRGIEFQIDFVKDGKCSGRNRLCGRDSDCACAAYEGNCVAGQTCVKGPTAEDTTIYYTTAWDEAPIIDFPEPYFPVKATEGLRWTCTHRNGIAGDPSYPPKKCHEGCQVCGWDPGTRTCKFCPTEAAPFLDWNVASQECYAGDTPRPEVIPRTFAEGDPMPLVFGLLADDDMCNMFGYFIKQ